MLSTAIGDPLGQKFWLNHFGADRATAPWSDFIARLLEFCDIHVGNMIDSKVKVFTTTEARTNRVPHLPRLKLLL
jgi:hypothetical protein